MGNGRIDKYMNINKIYIISPGNKDNGGGESLHQLCDTLNRLGYKAFMYYFDSKSESILEKMRIYNVNITNKIEDNSNNLIICPEMYTYPLRKYKKIKKSIWFLSLDFYLRSLPLYRTKYVSKKWNIPNIFFPFILLAVLIGTEATFKNFSFKKDNIKYFLYNVEYARSFIERECKGDCILKYLCGPINKIYFESKPLISKEKIVAYNPKKAGSFTTRIIELFSLEKKGIEFIPIQDMDQMEVKNLLCKSSVYMDFGFFPGPERIPREAVMMKCNIITSNHGSAYNDIDVPIPNRYKFELKEENIGVIINTIEDMVFNYDKYVGEFEKYREKVISQHEKFDLYVRDFIESVEYDKI